MQIGICRAKSLPPEGGRLCRSPGKLAAPSLCRSPIACCLLPIASTYPNRGAAELLRSGAEKFEKTENFALLLTSPVLLYIGWQNAIAPALSLRITPTAYLAHGQK